MKKLSIPSLIIFVFVTALVRSGKIDDLIGYLSPGSLLEKRQRTVQEFDGVAGVHLDLEGPNQDVLVVMYSQMTKSRAENFLRNGQKDGRIDMHAPWLTRSGFTKVRFQSAQEEWILDLTEGKFDH
jgi:hypothetical protein